MRYFLALYLFLFPVFVQASIVGSVGIEGTEPQKSNIKNDAGKPFISHRNLIGPRGELEYHFFKVLSVAASLEYAASKAEVQYEYTNPNDAWDFAKVNNQAATLSYLRLGIGVKLQLIRMERFRFFVGGGGIIGRMFLHYDQEEFRSVTGSTTGLKEKENKAIKGSSYEAGMDFLFKNDYGLRILAKRIFLKSNSFKTLADKGVAMTYTFASLSLIYHF